MTLEPKECFVAFVDLLGFSARVQAVNGPSDIEEIAGDVRKVKRLLGYNPTSKSEVEYQQVVDKTVLAFSDCIVVSVSYGSDHVAASGTFDGPMSELHSLAMQQAECVMEGIFLRGGVASGYWANEENLIVSDAMVTAYNLECGACVPVIAVDDEYARSIADEHDRKYYSKEADPFSKVFQRRSVGRDGQKIWFLNYFWAMLDALDGRLNEAESAEFKQATPERKNELQSIAYERSHRECCEHHATLIRQAYDQAGTDHIRYKYAWLAAYHNDIVRSFYQKPSSTMLCNDIAEA